MPFEVEYCFEDFQTATFRAYLQRRIWTDRISSSRSFDPFNRGGPLKPNIDLVTRRLHRVEVRSIIICKSFL